VCMYVFLQSGQERLWEERPTKRWSPPNLRHDLNLTLTQYLPNTSTTVTALNPAGYSNECLVNTTQLLTPACSIKEVWWVWKQSSHFWVVLDNLLGNTSGQAWANLARTGATPDQ
jgi:hypothetical protein